MGKVCFQRSNHNPVHLHRKQTLVSYHHNMDIIQGVGVVNCQFCSTTEFSDSASRCLVISSALMKFGYGSKDEKFKNVSSQLFTSLIFLQFGL